MASEAQRLTAEERSNLVAYLDGELTEEASRSLAAKVGLSPAARHEVATLELAWSLLDELPRPRATEEFTARTVSLAITQPVMEDQLADLADRTLRHAVRIAAMLLAAVAVLLAARFATARLWPDRTAELVEDLPLAESWRAYQDVGSFEFLRALDESSEFQGLGESPGPLP
jgi:anti-sigma factor RsiW